MGAPLYPEPLDLSALERYAGRRFSGVIYGLVDPRRPDKIAYVGRSKGHVIARYYQHISDGLEQNGQRCTQRMRWLAELAALRIAPRLVVIEHVGDGNGRLCDRESWWIAEYMARGEAWVNQSGEIQYRHKRKSA